RSPAAPEFNVAGLDGTGERLAVHVRHHQHGSGCSVLGDGWDQSAVVERECGRIPAPHRTGIPCSRRYRFVSEMGKAPSWKIDAASAASARPSVRTAARSRGWPAPPDAITGIWTALATAWVSARS